jgi:hypothetical protein
VNRPELRTAENSRAKNKGRNSKDPPTRITVK